MAFVLSKQAVNLIRRLCRENPSERIGVQKNEFKDLKVCGVSWNACSLSSLSLLRFRREKHVTWEEIFDIWTLESSFTASIHPSYLRYLVSPSPFLLCHPLSPVNELNTFSFLSFFLSFLIYCSVDCERFFTSFLPFFLPPFNMKRITSGSLTSTGIGCHRAHLSLPSYPA